MNRTSKTILTIYRKNDLLFRGRPIYPTRNIYGTQTITCEGERNFLRDAVIEPYLYQASPAVIFSSLLTLYNAQVEPAKRFVAGKVTVQDANDYVRLESEQAELISDTFDKLLERVGGYLVFTSDANGRRVLNWLATLDERCNQTIEIGENLLDYTETGANAELATVIYPYGAKDETTGARLDIRAVNNGLPYIKDDKAVALRGWVAKPFYWDDVTQANNLLNKARQQLNQSKQLVNTIEASVADLAGQGYDVDPLRVGTNVYVRIPILDVDGWFLLRERPYDLLDPSSDTVLLGASRTTLTGADAAGDRNALAQLRRSEQSTKIDYTIRITDAVVRTNK